MATTLPRFLKRPCQFVLTSPPGFRKELAAEIRDVLSAPLLPLAREAGEIQELDGGLSIKLPFKRGLELLSRLKTARTMVLRFPPKPGHWVRNVSDLRAVLKDVPWKALISEGFPVRPVADSRSSGLWHEGKIRDAVAAWFQTQGLVVADSGQKWPLLLLEHDRLTIDLPMAAEALWNRSYRGSASVAAPLREDLAQGSLAAAGGPKPGEFVFVPFAGSGTLYFEYALAAAGRPAASWGRQPALAPYQETWNWLAAREETNGDPDGLAIEWNDEAFAALSDNADRFRSAGLNVVKGDVFDRPWPKWIPDHHQDVFVPLNPPHGGRLGRKSDVPGLYGRIAKELSAFLKGGFSSRGYAICPNEPSWRRFLSDLDSAIARETRHFSQGGKDMRLVVFGARDS